jgi:hypothetical protein
MDKKRRSEVESDDEGAVEIDDIGIRNKSSDEETNKPRRRRK